MDLGKLIGKNSIDVVLLLPRFEWSFEGFEKVKMSKLFFAQYEIKGPVELKRKEDSFFHIETEDLSLEKIKSYLKGRGERTGVLSRVEINNQNSLIKLSGSKIGHIPMIDIDIKDVYFDRLKEQEILEIIKTRLGMLGLGREGIILSSSKKNYHVLGVERLLDEEELIDFLGNCLTKLRYKTQKGKIIDLVHPAHIGHSLNPLGYVKGNIKLDSQKKRFATLRISPKNEGEPFPRVIDIYRGHKK